ncbi:MAG: hypothetical protein J5891_03040 [Spirochaetales bacterium]|nr:hypothetical protein [Spirochaetales bacterium]
MKAPSSLRVICTMCFIFVILCTIPMFAGISGFFATLTAICTIICLLTAKLKSRTGRLLIALIPLVLLILAMLFGAPAMSLLIFITSAAVLLFFAVFMAVGQFETEYWKFRKTYIGITATAVFISIIYFLVYIAVDDNTKVAMNVPGVIGFTLALALTGIFVLTEMRSGEPDAKWRAKNAGRIIAIFSAAAAVLVLAFLILSFIFSLIEPITGPMAPKLQTERIRFNYITTNYSAAANFNPTEEAYKDNLKDDEEGAMLQEEEEESFPWELIAISVIVLGVAAFIICRCLKKRRQQTDTEVKPVTPEEQEQLDKIMKIRSTYRQYVAFLRRSGVQIGKGSTSEDILKSSKEKTSDADAEEEPNPEELEKGTEAEEKLRDIYIKARYGNPASITAEDAIQAATLLEEIMTPKE